MPRNRTTSDSRKPILEDTDCYDIRMESFQEIALPSLKQLFRHRAWEAWYIQKNEKNAIFYQTVSFCLKCLNYCDCQNDEIQDYLEQLKKEMSYQVSVDKKSVYSSCSNFDNINKYLDKEIISTCRKFPKEWTVIQLCKNYNPLGLSSKHEELTSYNTGILMTIFKHSAIKEMLMVDLKKPQFQENVFDKTYKVAKMINENVQLRSTSPQSQAGLREARERYVKRTAEIEVYIQDIINNLTSFFGPWIVALTGNFKSRKAIETENEIRKKVMEFLSSRKTNFSDYQQKLIHLVARRTDLLSHQHIFVAITYILTDKPNLGYNDVDLNDLYDHLTWIKQEFKYDDTSTHPCILIIDEILDQMPFEMINVNQEFTRICSFANLKRLWEGNCNSIENGYVVSPIANCHAIVNPDGSLTAMEDRLKKFFGYWMPTWKVFYREKPTTENYCEILNQSDVLVYSGHGSGLCLLSDNVFNFKSNAVVFLFGCGSASLTSSGLNSDMNGAHNYYHLGNCPSVVGFLWVVSDFPTDVCSTRMLSSWIPSNSKPHWQLIDINQWKKNNSLAFNRSCEVFTSPILTEVLTRARSDTELTLALRSSLVYRGLPVIANARN